MFDERKKKERKRVDDVYLIAKVKLRSQKELNKMFHWFPFDLHNNSFFCMLINISCKIIKKSYFLNHM